MVRILMTPIVETTPEEVKASEVPGYDDRVGLNLGNDITIYGTLAELDDLVEAADKALIKLHTERKQD